MRAGIAFAGMVIAYTGWACSTRNPRVEDSSKDAGDAGMDAGGDAGATEAERFAKAWGRATRDHFTRCCHGIHMAGPISAVSFPLPPARSGVRFDAAAAEKCIAETESLPCELQKQAHPIAPSCALVFSRGDVAIGQPCTSEFECAQPAGKITACIEHFIDKKVEFRCTVIREADEGDPCFADNDDEWIDCPSPLICDDKRNLCSAPAKLGDTCVTGSIYGDTCAGGAVCDRNDTHQCVKPKAIGESCSKLEDCEALACIDGVCVKPLFALPMCSR